MKKIISVVGPTASGKTSFALKIAKYILNKESNTNLETETCKLLDTVTKNINYTGIDIISVDSRQVYKGLEILSGADVPENFELVRSEPTIIKTKTKSVTITKKAVRDFPYFKHKNSEVFLHGVLIINLDQEWSVVHFKDFATKIILDSFANNRLPILVGGTGLYHQHLFNTDNSLYIPPNVQVREKAENLNVAELQNWLKKINLKKIKEMNNSDINNPRRLIRAIETSLPNSDILSSINNSSNLPRDIEIIDITIKLSLEQIKDKILKRVQERLEQGAIDEVKNLLLLCAKKDLPVCSTLGVSDISKFLNDKLSQEECKKNWALHEFQYAKRQLTWFKKS